MCASEVSAAGCLDKVAQKFTCLRPEKTFMPLMHPYLNAKVEIKLMMPCRE